MRTNNTISAPVTGTRSAAAAGTRSLGRRWHQRFRVLAPLLAIACLWTGPLEAHDFSITDVVATLSESKFRIDMTCDLDALLLGVGPGHDPEVLRQRLLSLSVEDQEQRLQRLHRLFERRVRVRFDGKPEGFRVSFPERTSEIPFESLGVTARLQGAVPEGVGTFSFFASRAFRAVRLEVSGGVEGWLLSPGEESPSFELAELDQRKPNVVLEYGALGIRHILPRGLDHALFVLGLFLLGSSFRELVWQISAFTVAHSVSLALAVLGAVQVSSEWVEPMIALSIVVIAVESLRAGSPPTTDTSRTSPPPRHRLTIVFFFGLLHGLGFAGVLAELGLPPGRLAAALLSFNVGVEVGQITVLALAFLALGAFRTKPWYRRRIVVPASLAVALIGAFWFVERIL